MSPPVSRRLPDFLENPRETREIELKRWLDLSDGRVKATVARHLMALANHGGGWVHFGFVEEPDGRYSHQTAGTCPDAGAYSTDAVNAIVQKYAQPPFHCDVFWQDCNAGCAGPHALIRVPGGHRLPIVSKRNGPEPSPDPREGVVYGRLVGPASAPVIAPDDWHRLLERCMRERRDELIETIREAVALLGAGGLGDALGVGGGAAATSDNASGPLRAWAADSMQRLDEVRAERHVPDGEPYPHGCWALAYRLRPAPDPPLSLARLREALMQSVGTETGWPAWRWPAGGDDREPRIHGETIECWMHGGPVFSDPAHADFWRVSQDAKLYLLRGYDEDAAAQLSPQHAHVTPGSMFDPVIAIWRVGECLLHAQRFAERAGGDRVEARVEWRGLDGRSIGSLDRPARWQGGTAHTDVAEAEVTVDAATLAGTLADVVHQLTAPVFVLFDFFEIDVDVVASELERMRGRRRR